MFCYWNFPGKTQSIPLLISLNNSLLYNFNSEYFCAYFSVFFYFCFLSHSIQNSEVFSTFNQCDQKASNRSPLLVALHSIKKLLVELTHCFLHLKKTFAFSRKPEQVASCTNCRTEPLFKVTIFIGPVQAGSELYQILFLPVVWHYICPPQKSSIVIKNINFVQSLFK